MGKEVYDILGINQQQLGDGEIDLIIRGKFRDRLSELLGELNEILNNNVEELDENEDENDLEGLIELEKENDKQQLTEEKKEDDGKETSEEEKKDNATKKLSKNAKKLRKIDKKIQAMFKALFAYMKVITKQAREENENGALSTVEEDMKDMLESLKATTKIEYRTRKESTKTYSNAYQILGIAEKSEGISENEIDQKIERKTLMRIQMSATKKLPYATQEIINMLFLLQGDIWAYSKINTTQNRADYIQELGCQRLSQEAKKFDAELGTIRRERLENFISVPIDKTDEGEIFSIIQTGRLVNRVIFMDEGSTNQYALERNSNGDKSHIMLYGNIDMERLKNDSKYIEFWKSILFSKNAISFSRKYMGGYIGEAKSTMTEVEGEQQEVFSITHKPQQVAICKKYRAQEKAKAVAKEKQARNNNSSTGEQPQGGESR